MLRCHESQWTESICEKQYGHVNIAKSEDFKREEANSERQSQRGNSTIGLYWRLTCLSLDQSSEVMSTLSRWRDFESPQRLNSVRQPDQVKVVKSLAHSWKSKEMSLHSRISWNRNLDPGQHEVQLAVKSLKTWCEMILTKLPKVVSDLIGMLKNCLDWTHMSRASCSPRLSSCVTRTTEVLSCTNSKP